VNERKLPPELRGRGNAVRSGISIPDPSSLPYETRRINSRGKNFVALSPFAHCAVVAVGIANLDSIVSSLQFGVT
jgi:hypothetical protein